MTVTVDYAKAQADGRFQASGTGAVTRTAQEKMRETWVTPQDFGAVADGATNDSAAFTAAFATLKPVYVPPGTYIATLSVRRNNVCLIGAGSSVVTIRQPAGALSVGGVFEVGDTASGNSATAYTGLTVHGITLDGNRANATAPTDDLKGHGLVMTKISNYSISDVRAINCHNAGVIPVINSNYGTIDCVVENCGNATYTQPGFDINSSKYIDARVVSKDCYTGGRVLDNCWGVNLSISVHNATAAGFIYTNQEVNESYGNNLDVAVDTAGTNGVVMGMNCHRSNCRFTVKSAGDVGINITEATITTKTFDGSSAVVVDTANDKITVSAHGWTTGRKVMYSPGSGGTAITGLTGGETYWVIRVDNDTLKLATSAALASAGTAVDLTAVGVGATHSLYENLRCQGNNITAATERSANAGLLLGGDKNVVTIASNQDGRSGAVGDAFAIDVEGNGNILHVQHLDSSPWKVRGIAVRSGATGNEIASYVFDNTLDPYSDSGTGTVYKGTLSGSATFNPANLADGAGETTTVTVTGAQLGDVATASFGADLQGISLTAYVSSANTVSVRLQNETGGAVDLGSSTLYASVKRRATP